MPVLTAGPYRVQIDVLEVLGDIGDRSIAGVRYLVKIGFEGADDLCYCGFSQKYAPSEIRTDGTRVTDEAPDRFFKAFDDALSQGKSTSHQTRDGRLSLRIRTDKVWAPGEPLHFKGDPDNVFGVSVFVNPYEYSEPGVPHGGGIGAILPVYREEMTHFIESWLAELRSARRTDEFVRQDHNGFLLRWIPWDDC